MAEPPDVRVEIPDAVARNVQRQEGAAVAADGTKGLNGQGTPVVFQVLRRTLESHFCSNIRD